MRFSRKMLAGAFLFTCISVVGVQAAQTTAVASKRKITAKVQSISTDFVEVDVDTSGLSLEKVQSPDGSTWVRFLPNQGASLLHGSDSFSTPEVPTFTLPVAVPVNGGIRSVEVIPSDNSMGYQGAPLYPVQKDHPARSIDKQDKDEFLIDWETYKRSKPVSVKEARGVDINYSNPDGTAAQVKVNLANVDVSTGQISWGKSVKIRVNFYYKDTTAPCFQAVLPTDYQARMDGVDQFWNTRLHPEMNRVVNRDLVQKYTCPTWVPPPQFFFGTRFLIVTHNAFLGAANALKNHKVGRGISTTVITNQTISNKFGDGSGNVTDAQVKQYVQWYYQNALIKPKWLLLMGDSEYIPTHYDLNNGFDSAKNAGDQYFAQFGGTATEIPKLGIGRMPVDSLTEANTVVNKVIALESAPPSVFSSYYSSTATAAQFQDNNWDGREDRWFAGTAETITSHLSSQGVGVNRIYNAPAGLNPTTFYDGTAIPAFLLKPGFPWNGSAADVTTAVNNGVSVLFHRDHGWWDGWGTPNFKTGTLAGVHVTGNRFPVVYSVNCASGIFDDETVDLPANKVGAGYGVTPNAKNFAETFLLKSDGAAAIIGDQRSSGTWINNDMAKGLFDATFPGLIGSYGGATVIRRLGDVINHAKGYVAGNGAWSATDYRQENTIYNLLGDPTLEVRVRKPLSINPGGFIFNKGLLVVPVDPRPTGCLTCPPEAIPEAIIGVVQSPEGRVLSRAIAVNNQLSFNLGSYQGAFQVTFSGSEFQQQVVSGKTP